MVKQACQPFDADHRFIGDQPTGHDIIGHPANLTRVIEEAVRLFWAVPVALDIAVSATVDDKYSDADEYENVRHLMELLRSIIFTGMGYPGHIEGEGSTFAAYLKIAVKQALVEFICRAWENPSSLAGYWSGNDIGPNGKAENLRRLEAETD